LKSAGGFISRVVIGFLFYDSLLRISLTEFFKRSKLRIPCYEANTQWTMTKAKLKMLYCPQCGKKTEHKKTLDWETLLIAIITCGIWLLKVRLYPSTCSVCGSENVDPAYIPAPF